ncbi:unnamed protein product [Nesidiocoris tenuis]|uniref:Uncharacterized protein n=1 Tax=Nesidiocoris tenuis TaxID=355587 RepID=A0A6H5HV10_9HEMI|nr:unnamed protein product [Nesidiocoris tenuis]
MPPWFVWLIKMNAAGQAPRILVLPPTPSDADVPCCASDDDILQGKTKILRPRTLKSVHFCGRKKIK